FGFAENTDDLFVGKTLLHGDVLMWLMKTLLTSGCTNQRGAGHEKHRFLCEDPFLQMSPYGSQAPFGAQIQFPHF
ncbi:hypothetical protein FP375_24200, partial [Enterobacter hormaechei]|nr:hypothetical protein [Enterobacter hormaechei]MBY5222430.1 hypothetical protein [Enterobacter hormaechei]